MDRKGIIGVIIAIAGLIAWNMYTTKRETEYRRALAEYQKAEEEKALAVAEAAAKNPPPANANSPLAQPGQLPPAIEKPKIEEQTHTLSTPGGQYTFTTLGGGIRRVVLKDHLTEGGAMIALNEFGTTPVGAVTEIAGEATTEPHTVTLDPAGSAITFERVDARQLQVSKRFSLPKYEQLAGKDRLREEYQLWLDVTFTNRGAQPAQLPAFFVHSGSASPIHFRDQSLYLGFNSLRGSSNKFVSVDWFKGWNFLWVFKGEPHTVYAEDGEETRWGGVTNQYFTTLLRPLADAKTSDEQKKQRGTKVWARRFKIENDTWKAAGHSHDGSTEIWAIDGALGLAGFTLAPGESATRKLAIYAGPREYSRLRELGNHEAEIMDFGMFGIISRTLLNSMNGLKGMLGNYAFAIIVLTIFIKLLMWPLQNKATNSMKKMQTLSPDLKAIQEKYRDDPAKLQQQTMLLWKKHGVSPFSGCLPMFIQIPIFFGFYNMLGKAVELRNSSFLWVHDLSQPDTILTFVGIPLNPLPLLMAATMLWSMQLTPKSGDKMQQRIFMFMPLIFIFMCYNFASALALYWTVQNLFSVVQLYLTRSKMAAPEAPAAAT